MSQPTSDKQNGAREAARVNERVQHERLRWWELEESARRCIAVSEHLWDERLTAAISAQRQLAETMRDRTSHGTRADGVTKYEIDRGVPVPLFTPRDRLQFLKEFATTLLISARQQQLPVTPEASREAQPDEATPADAAGETAPVALDVEAHELAEAGEAVGPGETPPGARRAR